jgi:hypothetical protein
MITLPDDDRRPRVMALTPIIQHTGIESGQTLMNTGMTRYFGKKDQNELNCEQLPYISGKYYMTTRHGQLVGWSQPRTG